MSIADKLTNMVDELQDAYNAIEEMGGTLPQDKNYKNLRIAINSINPDPLANAYVVLYTPGKAGHDTVEDASSVRAVLSGTGSVWPNNGWTHLKFTEKCQELNITSIGDNMKLANNIQVVEGMENLIRVTSIGLSFLGDSATIKDIGKLPPNLQTVGANFLYGATSFNAPITLPNSVTTLRASFLANCTAMNSPIVFSDGITDLPGNTMYNMTAFNSTVHLPENLKTIGNSSFWNLPSFNQSLTLPSTLTSLGEHVLGSMKNFTGILYVGTSSPTFADPDNVLTGGPSDPVYTTGVQIGAVNSTYWRNALPNITPTETSTKARKLIFVPVGLPDS